MTTTISKHDVQQQQQQQQQRITTEPTKQIQFDTLNNNNDAVQPAQPAQPARGQKRRSLLDFKSFDFHIKTLYSGLKASNKTDSVSQSRSSSLCGGTGLAVTAAPALPDLRIEVVDPDQEPEQEHELESMNLLMDYSRQTFMQCRASPAHSSSLSPYYLSPYMTTGVGGGGGGGTGALSAGGADDCGTGNIRRSSTSDIVSCRRRGSSSASNSRRPSTSDLLRRARERRGSEARMGRSVSHSTMRGGGGGMGGGGSCMGGRRTSMAF